MKETIEWIKVEKREPTEEEIEEWNTYDPLIPLCYMMDCKMPDDGEEILVQHKTFGVSADVCGYEDGYYLESDLDWDDIIAWAEMPKGIEVEK